MYRKEFFKRELDAFILFLKKLLSEEPISDSDLEKFSESCGLNQSELKDILDTNLPLDRFKEMINHLQEDFLKAYLYHLISDYQHIKNPIFIEKLKYAYENYLKKSKNFDFDLNNQINKFIS